MIKNEIRQAVEGYSSSKRTKSPSGRIWPNGEFTLGYSFDGEESGEVEDWAWTGGAGGLGVDELDERLECLHGWLDCVQRVNAVDSAIALHILTLSNASISHKPLTRTQKGLKGLSGYGTKMIRSGCFLLEEKLGKEDCVMITLTVPTVGRDARRKIAQHWGSITNRLLQYLTRELVKAGRSPAVIGCVEIQTGRLEKFQQAYLHLHLVCPAHSNTGGQWAVDVRDLRAWWGKCLERHIGTSLPHLPRVETAIVEKSVEGYLGKYLSKGTGEDLDAFIQDLGSDCIPAQWWFASAPMKAAIKSNTATGRNCGCLLDSLVNHLLEQGAGDGFEYIRHVDCDFNGLPVTVGYVGRLSPELRSEIFAMLDKKL
jgi:hypothetical protein